MSNTLKESMIDTINELGRHGWSTRRIAKELGINRRTVSKYLAQDSKCAISTTGDSAASDSKCTISTAGRKSKCAAYDESIRERLKCGLSAQRIFQDLQMEKDFEGSYESVKRYVRRIEEREEVPFREKGSGKRVRKRVSPPKSLSCVLTPEKKRSVLNGTSLSCFSLFVFMRTGVSRLTHAESN